MVRRSPATKDVAEPLFRRQYRINPRYSDAPRVSQVSRNEEDLAGELAEQRRYYVIDCKCTEPRQSEHVGELNGRPLPAVRLTPDYGHCRSTLHGEGKEDHQSYRPAKRHVSVQRILQMHSLCLWISAIQRSHGRDHDLARQYARDQSDADFPVESEGGNHRLDHMPHLADHTVREFRSAVMPTRPGHRGNVCQQPETHRHSQNDGARLTQEHLGAIDKAHRQRAQCGHPILWQLQDEWSFVRLKN